MNIQTVQFNNDECRECYKTNKREKGDGLVAITSEELRQYEVNDIVLMCTNNILT